MNVPTRSVDEPVLLALDDVQAMRGEAAVLHGVSFEIRPRRVTALLGRNGAGKTSTLLAILGRLQTTGSIRLHGDELIGRSTPSIVRRGIGYVPEDREVFADLTVEENLRLAARTPAAQQRRERIDQIFPEMLSRRDQRAGTLSGGQQQMVAISRALLNPNELLLIDEPSKGLAPRIVEQLIDVLHEASTESTILLVEQNLAVARALAADAVVLDSGRVVYIGSMADLFADEELVHRHLGVGTPAHREMGRAGSDSERPRAAGVTAHDANTSGRTS